MDYPMKWTRFENTKENRERFQFDGNYLLRWKGPLGNLSQAECFIRKPVDGVNGLQVLTEDGELAIPFHAIKQVKRVS